MADVQVRFSLEPSPAAAAAAAVAAAYGAGAGDDEENEKEPNGSTPAPVPVLLPSVYSLTITGMHLSGAQWVDGQLYADEGLLGRTKLSSGPDVVIEFHVESVDDFGTDGIGLDPRLFTCPVIAAGGDAMESAFVKQRTVAFGAFQLQPGPGEADGLVASGTRLVIAIP